VHALSARVGLAHERSYVVRRHSDNATKHITVLAAGGVADVASQEVFCSQSFCTVDRIFDQSSSGNHLGVEKGFSSLNAPRNGQ
jgi:hypothetical protein